MTSTEKDEKLEKVTKLFQTLEELDRAIYNEQIRLRELNQRKLLVERQLYFYGIRKGDW